MNNTTTQTVNFEAEEIFRQLKASKSNGFPFLAYSGLRAQIFSATELYLKAPRNPARVDNIMVSLNAMDTYTVVFNSKKGLIKRFEDIYAEGLAELIINTMGIN